ncbi:MAG: hypothetical protein NUW09_02530 [Deltaproteobacteria bacterium]|nr:hypothetical protein [Deltaproteobacteria bacterium]
MADNLPEILTRIAGWKSRSETMRSQYDQRWAKNQKLFKGIFGEEETTKSAVRGRSKIYYRKIWASSWRLVSSFYGAFLRDKDTFKIEGRGAEDEQRAKVLQVMTEYRRDRLFRTQSLFLKTIWAFFNIVNYGWTCGKWYWDYNAESGKDEPVYILYPNEQVFPDLSVETKEQMRYIIFVNYMTKEDMEEMGYENIEDAVPTAPPSNPLRQSRHTNEQDPLQNPGDNEYPSSGRYNDNSKNESFAGQVYEVWECFYREKGKIRISVSNAGKVELKQAVDSPYGSQYPVTMGTCLTLSHKLFGEGFPEPLEGPQESINAILNMRKDNVAMSLNRGAIVDKNGGVDLQSIVNRRVGSITLAQDVNAVKWDEIPDVTRTSYMEAAADEAMMSEMSGVTPGKQGMESTDKATVARINFSEANAKIDLFIALIGETYMKDFFTQLATLIQRFETDEKVFRIANDKFKKDNGSPYADDVYDLDFEADCIVNVGMGQVSRDMELQQTFLAWDRAMMSNQSLIQLVSIGAAPPEGIRLFDSTKFMEDVLPKLGHKDISKYFLMVKNAPQEGKEGGLNQGLAGLNTPQIGKDNQGGDMDMANMLQRGGNGG